MADSFLFCVCINDHIFLFPIYHKNQKLHLFHLLQNKNERIFIILYIRNLTAKVNSTN